MEPSSLPQRFLFPPHLFSPSVSCPLRLSEAPEASSFPPSFLFLFISYLLTLTLAMKNREVLTLVPPQLYFLAPLPLYLTAFNLASSYWPYWAVEDMTI